MKLEEFNHDRDHVHILYRGTSDLNHEKMISVYKSRTSREIKKTFPGVRRLLWKEAIWSRGYFLTTTGGTTINIIKKYIENQGG